MSTEFNPIRHAERQIRAGALASDVFARIKDAPRPPRIQYTVAVVTKVEEIEPAETWLHGCKIL